MREADIFRYFQPLHSSSRARVISRYKRTYTLWRYRFVLTLLISELSELLRSRYISVPLTRIPHIQNMFVCLGCFADAVKVNEERAPDNASKQVTEPEMQHIVPFKVIQETKMNSTSSSTVPNNIISGPQSLMPVESENKSLNVSIEDLFASGEFKIEADRAVEKISARLTPTITRMPSTLSRGSNLASATLIKSDPQGTGMRSAINQASASPNRASGYLPTSDALASSAISASPDGAFGLPQAGSDAHSQHRAFIDSIERIARMYGQGVPDYQANLTRWKAGEERRMRNMEISDGILSKSHPDLWPEPQRNPPWDKTPTVYSQVNPPWDKTPTVYSQVNPPFTPSRGNSSVIPPSTPSLSIIREQARKHSDL